MSRDNLSLVIADSSRLGTRVLEKILAPVADLVLCRDAGQLSSALAANPPPRLCLVSHQWPGLESWLSSLGQQRPSLVLLASPDSDAERLAHLSEEHDAGVLYRPYEPNQVVREVLHRLAAAPLQARPPTPATAEPPAPAETASAAASSSDTGTDSTLLARDRAFCRRHGLPHSVMAIRIQDHDGLIRELGEAVVTDAESAMFTALQERLRQEDSAIRRSPGQLALTLPGTPPLGARVLAHRLCAWLQKAEFEVNDFHIHFTIAIGIHCLASDSADDPDSILEEAESACLVAHASHRSSAVHLSDPASELAMHHVHQQKETEAAEQEAEAEQTAPEPEVRDPDAVWQEVEQALQASRGDGDSAREAVISKLTTVLRHLNESERMALVDELLMASALPES